MGPCTHPPLNPCGSAPVPMDQPQSLWISPSPIVQGPNLSIHGSSGRGPVAPRAFPRRWHRAGHRLLSPAGQHEGTCPSQRRHPLSTPQGPQDCPEPPAERAELTFGSAAPSPREGPGASGDRAGTAGTGLAWRGRGWHHRPLPPPLPAGMPGAGGAQRCSGGGHPAALRLFWTPQPFSRCHRSTPELRGHMAGVVV